MTKKLDILVHLDSMASIYDNPVKHTTLEAAIEIRKLRKQVEDDKADAERYRVLRSAMAAGTTEDMEKIFYEGSFIGDCPTEDEINSAIDAAMKGEKVTE